MARLLPLGRARSLTRHGASSAGHDGAAARDAAPSLSTSLRGRVALLGAAVAVALVGAVAPPVLADDDKNDLTERRTDLNNDLDQASTDLSETSAALVRAAGALRTARLRLDVAQQELATTRGELTAARNLDAQMQQELADAEQQLQGAEAALARTDKRMDRLRDDMGDFVADSYQYGSPGLISLGVVLNGGDASELGENLALADSVVIAQASTLDELVAAETLQKLEQERVEELRDEVAAKRAAAAENLVLKRKLTARAVEQTAAVRAIVATRTKAHREAARAKQIELDRIARLEINRARIEQMLRELAERERPPGPVIPADPAGSGGFLDLPLPTAYVTSPYGMRLHPILNVFKLHDGTDFGAACGTPVYAAADGEVVSAYYDSAYGNRVILANGTVGGASLATSYNHLASDRVAVGQSVDRGQLIGYAGTTGYSTGCHLHFMVYRNGATTNPMGWLS